MALNISKYGVNVQTVDTVGNFSVAGRLACSNNITVGGGQILSPADLILDSAFGCNVYINSSTSNIAGFGVAGVVLQAPLTVPSVTTGSLTTGTFVRPNFRYTAGVYGSPVLYSTPLFDSHSAFNNGVYTAPMTGIYLLQGTGQTVNGNAVQMGITKNGAAVASTQLPPITGGRTDATVSCIIDLALHDRVTFTMNSNVSQSSMPYGAWGCMLSS